MGQIENIKLHIVTDIKRSSTNPHKQNGERPKNPQDLLQGNEMQEAHPSQSAPVQASEETNLRQGTEALRTQTVRVRWTDPSHSSQEGQDHEEDRVENGVH